MKFSFHLVAVVTMLSLASAVNDVCADSAPRDVAHLGFAIRFGGRYDNVRKCVARKTGTKGGIAGDISAFADILAVALSSCSSSFSIA